MTFDPESIVPPGAKIKVIGIGGGGGNAVNTMIKSELEGVDFITANTDIQSLNFSLAEKKLQLGKQLTKGLGAGANPEVGRDAALEDREELERLIDGADMVFITAGMGGGTGTGGASVVAQVAREAGALTVAVVTKPFLFEGKKRRRNAEEGIERLRECVDTLITIPNQRLLHVATPDLSMIDAFKMADDVLVNAVRGISDIINIPGIVNVDFADVKTVMARMGQALMGIGSATGENRAIEAARQAIQSPLLEDINIEGATGILINITSGQNISLMEVNSACSIIQDAAHEDANIIIGAVIDNELTDEIRVTVIATGFPLEEEEKDLIERIKLQNPMVPPRPTPEQKAKPAFPSQPDKKQYIEVKRPAPNIAAVQHNPPLPPKTQVPQAVSADDLEPAIIPEPPKTVVSKELNIDEISSFSEDFGVVAQNLTNMTLGTPTCEDTFEAEVPVGINMASIQQPEDEVEEISKAQETTRSLEKDRAGATLASEEDLTITRSIESGISHTPSVADQLFTSSDDPMDADEPVILRSERPQSQSFLLHDEPIPDDSMNLDTEPPMKCLFDDIQEQDLAMDIDKKIDEALELAEKIKQPELSDEDDDIDVPTFLRNGMKDLPLN